MYFFLIIIKKNKILVKPDFKESKQVKTGPTNFVFQKRSTYDGIQPHDPTHASTNG